MPNETVNTRVFSQKDLAKHLINEEKSVTIELNNVKIETFDEDTFKDCKQLKNLNLSNNEIKSLHEKIFKKKSRSIISKDTNELERLNLSNNLMKTLNQNIFDECVKLRYLNLSFNCLTDLNENIFEKCINLETINLSNNKLTKLSKNLFKPCKQLKKVYLANNKLEYLNANVFDDCNQLHKIDLTNNSIKALKAQNFQYFLEELEIQMKNGVNFVSFQIPTTGLILIYKLKKPDEDNSNLKRTLFLHWAFQKKYIYIIKNFLTDIQEFKYPEINEFLNKVDMSQQAILHLSANEADYDLLKQIIDLNLDLNLVDSKGDTMIHIGFKLKDLLNSIFT